MNYPKQRDEKLIALLRSIRKESGATLEQLSQKLGVAGTTVCNWLSKGPTGRGLRNTSIIVIGRLIREYAAAKKAGLGEAYFQGRIPTFEEFLKRQIKGG